MTDWAVVIEALPKAVVYLALLGATGTCAARWWSRVLGARRGGDAWPAELDRALGRMLSAAAAALVAGLVARAWTHSVAALGFAEALVWENVRLIAWESGWGTGWRVQVVLALGLAGAGMMARVRPGPGWVAASGLATACCYALPLVGHAAGEPARLALHGSHLLGAGLWLGSLAALRLGHPSERSLDRGLAGFAPLALSGAGVVGLTGAGATWIYLGVPSGLWLEPYGGMLILKLAAVAGVAFSGLRNWRHYHGRGASTGAHVRPSRVVGQELLLAALVVVLTAVLSELPHPQP